MSLLMLLLLFHVAVAMLAVITNYIKIEHGTRNISVRVSRAWRQERARSACRRMDYQHLFYSQMGMKLIV